MKRPEMILFDYGDTLVTEADMSLFRGNTAIFPYITENPRNVTPEEFHEYLTRLYDEIRALRGELIEIHEHVFLRNVLEHFGIKLSVSIEEAERLIWDGISPGIMTPGADRMLSELRKTGIRTGVISNLCWSGDALTERLRRIFPEHDFEFIITSSEYIFRKPDPHIFSAALGRSGLNAEDIWFCGNDVEVDVLGAHGVGMLPVWYDDRSCPSRFHEKNDRTSLNVPHLRLSCWEDLVAEVEKRGGSY